MKLMPEMKFGNKQTPHIRGECEVRECHVVERNFCVLSVGDFVVDGDNVGCVDLTVIVYVGILNVT